MKTTWRFGMVLAWAVGMWGGMALADEPAKEMNGLPLVFEDSFDGGLDAWVATDENAWEIVEEDGNKVLGLVRGSNYEPPVRSPLNIIRVKDLEVTDFVLEARLKQTGREYGHRDLCVFFGYNDPSHFYYVHMATKADDHANSIFIVNGEPRLSIAKERTNGTDWGTGYHTVRVQRDTVSGTVQVFFDDMEKPIMVAEDKTFASGGIGLGSFDDVGQFDGVRLWGKKKE
ncbi:MAG TPA: hypothetical protein PLO37_11455 [Candidatus Hydrogenedentes bacterium]|nr:hypothetical protein [Candidatus Hydrogenedentota bacterium]HPG67456.1 hypothetical protein [Candidatus Hydrogenedentota bacterium]